MIWLILTAQALLVVGYIGGYWHRRRQAPVRITYAGGTPYASLTVESPRGAGSDFAVAAIRTILEIHPDTRKWVDAPKPSQLVQSVADAVRAKITPHA